MRDLRILFMGTPDFAVETLKTIIENKYNVVGVITAPDKPAGRGRKLRASAVKEYAVSKNLKILQPTNLKDEKFIEELASLKANLNIVVAFRMLPKVVWNMPKYGTFNLHASLLPDYRGAAPINWAIINGEKKSGITTFFIDEKIDTGNVIFQKEVIIDNEDTAGILHDKLMIDGAKLVLETIKAIENDSVSVKPQPKENTFKTAYKLNRENTKINWKEDINIIHNLIKGLSPYPSAWCNLYNKGVLETIKIYNAHPILEVHNYETGKIIIEDSIIKVAVQNGYILVDKLQLPGKKAMDSKALLNGYDFYRDAKMS
ncbi:methionyl-tRNA formyltransferase [Aquimarina muelleri]|uniref:Methionyl-tRNA formyltransferase n=1 Tax=Aquimarina muelleri TaxID=279356 RepID=A0A918N2T4_9FLAO|nr:methionyl-tRNA formyltransferase [Aquimarina muelleri]MCX2761732.1 methionyl-tRNA formyltransferase [Aquimarina muelleri]GGX15759.1 methionyl-tRNA formyltransferase [Aquimarina muelleri]